ncbi:MAG: dTMP kinase, partial [Clostridia bacterium]
MFVTFEGCEGVGKSTQLRIVKDYIEATHQHAVFVREPGSTEISEQIRSIILNPENKEMADMTEALLYAAARAQLVAEVIKPALKSGMTVICDRFIDSSVAYQGYARGLGADLIKQINAPALDGCMPDLTVFLDLPPTESFRTVKTNDRLEQEHLAFHEKVYAGFNAEIEASRGRIVRIK